MRKITNIVQNIDYKSTEKMNSGPAELRENMKSKIKSLQGLPWWHSVWESACQCRGHGFEPWSGKSHIS